MFVSKKVKKFDKSKMSKIVDSLFMERRNDDQNEMNGHELNGPIENH